MWRNKKQASGYGQRSHSIFAEYLLHRGPGNTISISKRQRLDFGVNSPGKYSLIPSVDFAISSLTLCLSKALVGSLCANMSNNVYKVHGFRSHLFQDL